MSVPPTFFVSDRRMLQHKCEWDADHIEKPDRLSALLDTIESDRSLFAQCVRLPPAECPLSDILLVHSSEYIQRIREASSLPDLEAMEQFSSEHEDIYVNGKSWECALLSAGCAVKATEALIETAKERAQNGESEAPNAFVAIRPPGHHASQNDPCGFCLLNNVAICARKARSLGVERVLIVDWDVHAAQGTQYCVEGDPEGILLLSIHRFERGTFWPELPESAIVHQYPNTINVPLNSVGCGDAEYAAFFHCIVLPIIHQWRPGLVLVSCGFDAGIGDPQGQMEVSPAGFGYMTGLLAQQGVPLCLLLEGGYFLPSVCHGALQSLRALVQRAPPIRHFCQLSPSPDFMNTLFQIQFVHRHKWPFFARWLQILNALRAKRKLRPIEVPQSEYFGQRQKPLAQPQPTRGQYPPREKEEELKFELRIQTMLNEYENRESKKRDQIELSISKNEKSCSLLLTLPDRTSSVGFPLSDQFHFLMLYFFILLPLAFQEYDIKTTEGKSLPLTFSEVEILLGQIGGENNAGNEEEFKVEISSLESITEAFPKLASQLLN
ncbi:hypothetical protein niasHT_013617 [Heterodera trifolii]|uniref:Histone deacetylase domain-containing protein n=1 Tax=Heterodera trifolii TaxID=157864 RepID=A0ABD2LE66_9BILA